jgi:hypothetical protein
MVDTPVSLTNVFVHDVYGSYFAVDDVETTNFYRAGIIATDGAFNAIAGTGGKQVTFPYWLDLDPSIEPNYSNDDFADEAVIHGLTTGSQTARMAWVNQVYGSMDIVRELANSNPMERIRSRFQAYWERQLQHRLIAQCTGILADNVANDASDMIIDISALAGSAAIFNSDAFIDAAYTMGDHAENIRAIAVHSLIMARMVKNDEIVYIPDSKGVLTVPTYKGRLVVVDDGLPVTGAGADRVFTSILFGSQAFGFGGQQGSVFALGVGTPAVPFEVFHYMLKGHGGGAEAIAERNTWLMHPFGYTWVEGVGGGAPAELSPSLADLRLAAHWDRVLDRKLVPLAFIKSKG